VRTNTEIKAGDLRERIQFLNPNLYADGYGGFYTTASVTYICWAKVTNLSGTRQNSEDQMVIKNKWEILIRRNELAPVTKSMHIIYDQKTFVISEINDVQEYNRMIKIIATQRD
jgi:SPP1 family predicted phage head-tail adaptor